MFFTALLAPLFSLLGNIIPSLKDYASYKMQALQYQQQYQLALLQAQASQAAAQLEEEGEELKYRMEATTPAFKQTTFWLLWVPVFFTMVAPNHARIMWNNFNVIPQMFQWLFMCVYASIWGIPLAKNGWGSITDLLAMRWDKKIDKAAVDHKVVFNTLKAIGLAPKGFTTQQVSEIDKAIDAGVDTINNAGGST